MSTNAPGHRENEIAARLRLAVGRVTRLLRQSTASDLTASQYSALVGVAEHGPIRLTELAALEGVTAPTVARLVDVLTKRGLLERTADPTDGRSVLILVTGTGNDLLSRTRGARTAMLADRLRSLSPEQVDALERALPALEALAERTPSR